MTSEALGDLSKAIAKGVPLRYYDPLSDKTVFEKLGGLAVAHPTASLDELDNLLNFPTRGLIEFVYLWFKTFPLGLQNLPGVYQAIHELFESRGETLAPEESTPQELLGAYNLWSQRFENELQADRQRFEKERKLAEEISTLLPVHVSPIKITAHTVTYSYRCEVGVDPLPEIFAKAKTSYIIPYIQYDNKFKIYGGKTNDARPIYYNSVHYVSNLKENILICRVWSEPSGGDLEQEARFGKQEGFKRADFTYNPDLNKLTVKITTPYVEGELTEREIIQRLSNTFINLPPPYIAGLPFPPGVGYLPLTLQDPVLSTELSGEFSLYEINYIEALLFDLIMTDNLLGNYLYLNENEPIAEKRDPSINFRSSPSIDMKLRKRLIDAGDTISVLRSNGTIEEGSYLNPILAIDVHFKDAASLNTSYYFLFIFSRLMKRYADLEHGLVESYLKINSTLLPFIQEEANLEQQTGQLSDLNPEKQLRKQMPDLFITGYNRVCSNPLPKLIKPEEVPEWQETRKILQVSSPVTGKQSLFVCPDERFQYPRLMENKSLPNNNLYPYIPCCYETDTGKVTKVKQTFTREHSQYVISRDDILDQGRDAHIPKEIETFLQSVTNSGSRFLRFATVGYYERDSSGLVSYYTNTFLHCVFRALEIPEYMESPEREDYVDNFRANLFTRAPGVVPETAAQELYDLTSEQIKLYAQDNSRFFDPLHFYRLLEEIFNCNIYIFSSSEYSRTDKLEKHPQKTSFLQLPRYSLFHSHIHRPGLPTICVMRHWGPEAQHKVLKFPTVELLTERFVTSLGRNQKEIYGYRYVFDERMNESLYNALRYISQTLTWQIDAQDNETRKNLYSLFNWRSVFGQQHAIRGQVIDSNGKARLFVLSSIGISAQIYVNVLPTAPLNAPLLDAAKVKLSDLPTEALVKQLFGKPYAYVTNFAKTQVIGYWFSIGDIEFGVEVPFQPVAFGSLPQIQSGELRDGTERVSTTVALGETGSVKQSPIKRIQYLKRAAYILLTIIKYLYVLSGKIDLNQFLARICALAPPGTDSIDLYFTEKIPRVLPSGKTPEEVLQKLQAIAPEQFHGARIPIFNEGMYIGLVYQLKKFAKSIDGLVLIPDNFREIKNFYQFKSDYPTHGHADEFLLLTPQEFDSWADIYISAGAAKERIVQNLKDNINFTLNADAYRYQDPYVYTEKGKYYLVQNASMGDFLRVINVAVHWYQAKVNLGYTAKQYLNESLPAHVIYGISPSNRLQLTVDKRVAGKGYIEILNYGRDYAALLPL